MTRGKFGPSDVVSYELRERAEALLNNTDISEEETIPPSEMLRELRLQQIQLKLQREELEQYREERDELVSERDYFADLYFNAPVGYLTLDQEGQIGEANYLAAELLGTNKKSLLTSALFEHIKSCCQHKLKGHLNALFGGTGVHHCRLNIELPTGTTVHLKMLSIAIDDGNSGTLQCRSALFDITDAHQAEQERELLKQQLHESHRMETLGRLASGIAHDFNNLLTLIIGYSKLAINQLSEDEPFSRHAKEINKAGHHAAELIEQLLAFSRSGTNNSTPVAANELIADMESMLDRLIGDEIELHLRLRDQLGVVHFDSSQFQQVLMNLVVNAREAMTEGGNIIIRSRNIKLSADEIGDLDLEPGSYVTIEVEDNGNGIPPEVIAHIFEPFFTTKSTQENRGFGLSTTYGIVRRHGGIIDVESTPGSGTNFSIYLPRVDDDETNADQGPPTILVVDDQPDLRDFATLVLEEMDVEVLSARGSEEALQISRACGDDLDLVVTDVTMPGLSGPQLLERIRQHHPGARVIYISGYDRETIAEKQFIEPEAPFLEKPFSPENLRELVDNTLDDERSS